MNNPQAPCRRRAIYAHRLREQTRLISCPTQDAANELSKSYVLTMVDVKNAANTAKEPVITSISIPQETLKAIKQRGRPKKSK